MYLNKFQTSINLMLNCGTKLAQKVKTFIFSMPNELVTKINNFVDSSASKSKLNSFKHLHDGFEWEIEYEKEDGLTIRKNLKRGVTLSLFLPESKNIKKDYNLMRETYSDLNVGQFCETRLGSETSYDVDICYRDDGQEDLLESILTTKYNNLEYTQKGKHFPLRHECLIEYPIYLN